MLLLIISNDMSLFYFLDIFLFCVCVEFFEFSCLLLFFVLKKKELMMLKSILLAGLLIFRVMMVWRK